LLRRDPFGSSCAGGGMSSLTVNRCLNDKSMDHIDHALGRPLDPMGETYRNHFATSPDSDEAKAFRQSPNWEEASRRGAGNMAFFYVTQAGARALRDHLKSIGDKHRAFSIRFEGYTAQVVAETASKAKYNHWLKISDCWSELTFKEYCKRARVVSGGAA